MQGVSKFKERATNTVRIYMAIIRMPAIQTDFMVTLNVPIVIDPLSSSSAVGTATNDTTSQDRYHSMLRDILQSLSVLDWHLFDV
jgi:hypothetical protein